jgi:asparagine synthase (glutamine-hydrolysing)
LPDNFKVRGGQTKHILKETLRRRVPAQLLSRRKAGFPLPVSRWLRYELKDFVHGLLLDSKGSAREYLRRSTIHSLLAEHDRSGNRGKEVFSLVVLELWRRQFVGAPIDSRVASL